MTKAEANEAFVKAVQTAIGVPADGWAGRGTQAGWTAFLAGQIGVSATAPDTPDIPDDYWPMLSKIESGDRPYIKATTSSASGLYQFIKRTWIGEGGAWGSDMTQAFGGLRPTVEEQLTRAKTFTQRNADALKRAGVPVNNASLYACHFLGAGTAIPLIKADIHTKIADIVSAEAIKANWSILGDGKVQQDFLAWLFRKTGAWAR